MERQRGIFTSLWFHRRFRLTPDGRYDAQVELAEWARGPYDTLRKNLLLHAGGNGHADPRIILLAPARHGDGTTTTAILLAASLATVRPTVVVDLNFRWPGVSEAVGLNGAAGLGSLLRNGASADLDAVVHSTPVLNLHVLPNGSGTGQRAIPDTHAIGTVIEALRVRFEYVIIDAAPVPLYPDTSLLASLADATIMVVAADATPLEHCLITRQELDRAGARLLGAVVTRQRRFVPEPLARRIGVPDAA